MYWTHHFAHHDTLKRARWWLERMGFTPDRMEVHQEGVPRIALIVSPFELAEVEMLIHAVERTDPEGWPSFWHLARQEHRGAAPAAEPALESPRRFEAIGWHPPD